MKNHTKRIIYLMVPVVFMVFGVTGCKDVVGDLEKSEPQAPSLTGATAQVANEVVNPTILDPHQSGNAEAECAAVGEFDYAYKIDEWEDGLPPEGWSSDIFTITPYPSTKTFDWEATVAISAVIVKGGPIANLWSYDPAVTSDEGLYAPDDKDVSHVTFCWNEPEEGRSLDVSKTVVTSYTRTHEWDIDKKVETENEYELDDFAKIWLFIDGSGDEKATWTVDVTYEGYKDSDWNVSGVITIENIGTSMKSITAITDMLGGSPISVDCGEDFELPYDLPVGETLTCDYDEDVNSFIEGNNVVTVTVEGEEEPYTATEPIVWGDPTTELYKTVKIEDISDLFGTKDLGSVTAPNGDTFTYDKEFAWADFVADDCGGFTYDNTATIVETDQDAEATLKVNVQCFIYDTAYAKSDDGVCFIPTFSNWGWTNPMSPGDATWNLWAGAAQCDTDKGTLVGSVFVGYDGDGYVTVEFDVFEDYVLEEYHVYVGTDMFPKDRRGNYTVAPGQYVNNSPFDGSDVYVIAHGVVGYPDPDFGP